ncbi:MAG: type II secretion system F family protein [Atopobiaceae bacterium]|nr:type II secretion system F family protein [Atopobiaceae bacterium]
MSVLRVACAAIVGLAGFGCAWIAVGSSRGTSRHKTLGRAEVNGLIDALGASRLVRSMREQSERRERARRATRDMPVFLDIVTLGIAAGLSFDASLELYCERYQTPLANMMRNAMLSWRMGVRGRAEALRVLASEVASPAMKRFATTVTDALAFGTPLASALERQAQVIRDEQRSQVEEEIERVPVRMLIPLGTLIVPAMLLTILGPLLGPALGMA